MREKLIKRLNEILKEILKANDAELDKIGLELLDIEKKLIGYTAQKTNTNKKF